MALTRGDRVELRGFGDLPSGGATCASDDPRTGEVVAVEAKSVPFFKAGKQLRLRMDTLKTNRTVRKQG